MTARNRPTRPDTPMAALGEWQDPAVVRAWLAAIVDSSDDVIVSKTLDGVITSWNRAAERMFEWTAEEAIGRHITLIIPPDRHHEGDEVLARLRRGERIDHFETVRVSKSGQLREVSITISPIRDAQGRIVGASKIARDIGSRRRADVERERLLASEQAARAALEAANRAKDDFLATLSHELRTPLNAILGWAQVVEHARDDRATVDRALESIVRNVGLQTRLVEDLLDLSAILNGRLRLYPEAVDLRSVLATAADSVRPAAAAKGVELRRSFDPAVAIVPGDPARIQQVVWNLLSNAIKFTPRGGHVLLELLRGPSQAVIRVTDSGIGISPDTLGSVFDRFRQGDSSITRRHGGLGLGLAIVKQLVEMHGGSVEGSSRGEGRGSVFTVALPAGPMVPFVTVGERRAAGRCDGVRVVVVDDDAESRTVTGAILEQCGAQVTLAGSAGEALARLREASTDVLISDLAMPGGDGYSLLRQVRRLESGRALPAIALTARTGSDARVKAFEAGFDTYLLKPVDAAELIAAVTSLARRTAA